MNNISNKKNKFSESVVAIVCLSILFSIVLVSGISPLKSNAFSGTIGKQVNFAANYLNGGTSNAYYNSQNDTTYSLKYDDNTKLPYMSVIGRADTEPKYVPAFTNSDLPPGEHVSDIRVKFTNLTVDLKKENLIYAVTYQVIYQTQTDVFTRRAFAYVVKFNFANNSTTDYAFIYNSSLEADIGLYYKDINIYNDCISVISVAKVYTFNENNFETNQWFPINEFSDLDTNFTEKMVWSVYKDGKIFISINHNHVAPLMGDGLYSFIPTFNTAITPNKLLIYSNTDNRAKNIVNVISTDEGDAVLQSGVKLHVDAYDHLYFYTEYMLYTYFSNTNMQLLKADNIDSRESCSFSKLILGKDNNTYAFMTSGIQEVYKIIAINTKNNKIDYSFINTDALKFFTNTDYVSAIQDFFLLPNGKVAFVLVTTTVGYDTDYVEKYLGYIDYKTKSIVRDFIKLDVPGQNMVGYAYNCGISKYNELIIGLYTHPTSGAHSSPKIENILYINFSFNVKFNSNGGSSVQSQTIAYNNKAVKPTMPKRAGYTFVHWYKDSSLKSVYNFNTPVTDDIVLYAKWKANVKKITAPITRFSIKKGKVIKFKYALIYSDNKLTQKSKKIKFNKLGKRNVIIKSANKKLKLIINVTKKTIKPIKPVVKVAKQNNLYFIKIKSKNVAYYKFPKFNKITGSSYYKYGIYTKKSTKNKTVKVKWWNKNLKKKIK